MFVAGGASVTCIGFRREQELNSVVQGIKAVDLGKTTDGRLVRRAMSVAGALAKMQRDIAPSVCGSDVIVARNLEMLVIAARARRLYAPNARLVYESLDVHRLLLSDHHPVGGILRSIETSLWRDVDLLLTSSPAFVQHYFLPRRFRGHIHIEENRIVDLDSAVSVGKRVRPAPNPPWRIGMFGMIRCRRSLNILNSLADASQGAVEITVRGRPSESVFPDFAAELEGLPHIQYFGPYRNPDDLSDIYGQVHFNWTIDYYEAGQNSTWLLPCRMYEGSLFGAVPIAEEGVETAGWLVRHGVGVILKKPIEQHLAEFFQHLDEAKYASLAQQVRELPIQNLLVDQTECQELVRRLLDCSQHMTAQAS